MDTLYIFQTKHSDGKGCQSREVWPCHKMHITQSGKAHVCIITTKIVQSLVHISSPLISTPHSYMVRSIFNWLCHRIPCGCDGWPVSKFNDIRRVCPLKGFIRRGKLSSVQKNHFHCFEGGSKTCVSESLKFSIIGLYRKTYHV